MNKEPPLYKVKNLHHHYTLGEEIVSSLQGVDLEIHRGEFVTLVGPSGSGKSTLLNLLGLIEPLQKGSITFEDADFQSLNEKKKNAIRKYKLGFIFQSFHLIDVLTAEENVSYFLARQGIKSEERRDIAQEALKLVGLSDHTQKKPMQMSGGQRQRVAIARAVAKNPKVIIADEPTANLDQKTGYAIMQTMHDLTLQKKLTIITATHDPMIDQFSSKRLVLNDGKIG